MSEVNNLVLNEKQKHFWYLGQLENRLSDVPVVPELNHFYSTNDKSENLFILYRLIQKRSVAVKEGNDTSELDEHIKFLLSRKEDRDLFASVLARGREELRDVYRNSLFSFLEANTSQLQDVDQDITDQRRRIMTSSLDLRIDKAKSQKLELARLQREKNRLENERNTHLTFPQISTDLAMVEEEISKFNSIAEILAFEQYQKILRYSKQLGEGFVWTRSREEILDSIIESISQNGKYPFLIGESGTGKSSLANAASLRLTGYLPVTIDCNENLNAQRLVSGTTQIGENGSYQKYGPILQALSGRVTSDEKVPSYQNGRFVRFEESLLAGDSIYALSKQLFSLKPGSTLEGEKILPGFGFIYTTNPQGERYNYRTEFDAAFMRELQIINVGYMEMTPENPELYEYMLACLMDENGVIRVPKHELAPSFELNSDDYFEYFTLDENINSHGFLYRMALAVKKAQDCFVEYNSKDKHSNPKFFEGLPAYLKEAVITPEDIKRILQSYKGGSFTLTMIEEIRKFISKAKEPNDRQLLTAIFDHYFQNDTPEMVNKDNSNRIPEFCTPLDIGFLSPKITQRVEYRYDYEPNSIPGLIERNYFFDDGLVMKVGTTLIVPTNEDGLTLYETMNYRGVVDNDTVFDSTKGPIKLTQEQMIAYRKQIEFFNENGNELASQLFLDYESSRAYFHVNNPDFIFSRQFTSFEEYFKNIYNLWKQERSAFPLFRDLVSFQSFYNDGSKRRRSVFSGDDVTPIIGFEEYAVWRPFKSSTNSVLGALTSNDFILEPKMYEYSKTGNLAAMNSEMQSNIKKFAQRVKDGFPVFHPDFSLAFLKNYRYRLDEWVRTIKNHRGFKVDNYNIIDFVLFYDPLSVTNTTGEGFFRLTKDGENNSWFFDPVRLSDLKPCLNPSGTKEIDRIFVPFFGFKIGVSSFADEQEEQDKKEEQDGI